MKIYIATRLGNAQRHRELAAHMCDQGHTITYDWTAHGSVKNEGVPRLMDVAVSEARGVAQADVVIGLLPGGRGTHCEIGMGIALGKKVVLHAEVGSEFFSADERTCAFYHHPCVTQITGEWGPSTILAIVSRVWGPRPAVMQASPAPEPASAPWEKFRRGDALTDAELQALIEESEWGERFLESREETGGVLRSLRGDLHLLRSFERARNDRRK